jgi:integrase
MARGHTHATIALSSGISPQVVSRRLGHANITVTLGLYAHLLPGDDEAAAATVAGAVLGNSVTNP